MADKKKTAVNTRKKENEAKKPIRKKKAAEEAAAPAPKVKLPAKERPVNMLLPFVFAVVGLFMGFCFIFTSASGAIGVAVKDALFGVFGISACLLPVLLFILGIFWRKIVGSPAVYRAFICGTLLVYFASVFFGTLCSLPLDSTASALYKAGAEFKGGGVIGGLSAQLFASGIGEIFTAVLSFVFALVTALLTFGVTPSAVIVLIGNAVKESNTAKDGDEDEDDGEEDAPAAAPVSPEPQKPARQKKKKQPEGDVIYPEGRSRGFQDIEIDERPKRSEKSELEEMLENEEDNVESFKKTRAEKYFEDDIVEPEPEPEPKEDELPFDPDPVPVPEPEPVIEVKRTSVPEKEPEGDAYVFPPVSLLTLDTNTKQDAASKESREGAERLLDVLDSFKVRATVENVARGPAVTRYELKPAPGVRIASISKLVDEIALSFSVSSVRFEPSIEGKGAVGIEVPNKIVSTVHIRSLIDTDRFRDNKSKIACALGMDVTGEPVFCDIAKMPHMLVAGATGMGKSVCINCLIVSILYKATPDDVKLILIDPKKVEFIPYSGIPHLLVPVITDAKKAAGTLNWLVGEMERRYDLIEAVGCRDIISYNKVTAGDPEKEHLPQIVIIIDEFADLMATASDSVDLSIQRISQKARAAGMHLIIGTQRPTVDVITGTIKANIPGRIACKTTSQTDSRTVIDIAGAEKLIGRGDMLFMSSGALNLLRVQGAFVSESEVEAVTSFVKAHGATNYNSDVIKRIDEEAKNINTGKKKLEMNDSENEDELLLPAIECCFAAGRASTSHLQSKLSIGYGRAAKLLDRMQEMGICSGTNGTKPREMIMSREQFEAAYGSMSEEE